MCGECEAGGEWNGWNEVCRAENAFYGPRAGSQGVSTTRDIQHPHLAGSTQGRQ